MQKPGDCGRIHIATRVHFISLLPSDRTHVTKTISRQLMQKAILLIDQNIDRNDGLGLAHSDRQNPKTNIEEEFKNLYLSIMSKTEACSKIWNFWVLKNHSQEGQESRLSLETLGSPSWILASAKWWTHHEPPDGWQHNLENEKQKSFNIK